MIPDKHWRSTHPPIGGSGSNPGSGINETAGNEEVSEPDGCQADANFYGIWRAAFPPNKTPTYVYAIQAGTDGPVKIGVAVKPWERLATLQTANATRLRGVAAWRGSDAEEDALHKMFAAYRLEGEWFEPDPDLIAWVELLGVPTCAFVNPEDCLGERCADAPLPAVCESCGMEFV